MVGADDIVFLLVNENVVTARWHLSDLAAWAARHEATTHPPDIACRLRAAGFTGQTYQLTGLLAVVDAMGNERDAEGVEVIIPPALHEQFNCENVVMINIENAVRVSSAPDAAFRLHPLLQE